MEISKEEQSEINDFMFSLGKVVGYLSRGDDCRLSILLNIEQNKIDILKDKLIDLAGDIRNG